MTYIYQPTISWLLTFCLFGFLLATPLAVFAGGAGGGGGNDNEGPESGPTDFGGKGTSDSTDSSSAASEAAESDAAGGVASGDSDSSSGVAGAVGEAVGGIADAVGEAFGGIADGISDVGRGFADAVGDVFGGDAPSDAAENDAAGGVPGADSSTGGSSAGGAGIGGPGPTGDGPNEPFLRNEPNPLPDLTINLESVDVSGADVTAQGFILNVGDAIALTPAKREKEIVVQMDIDLDCNGDIDTQKAIDVDFVSLRNDGSKLTFRGSTKVEAGDHCLELDVDADNRIVESTERNNVSRQVDFTVEEITTTVDPGATDTGAGTTTDNSSTTNINSEFANDLSGSNLKQSKNIDLFVRAVELGDDNDLVPFEQRLFNPVTDYQTTNLTISPDQHVAIKYSSRGFNRCVTSFFNAGGATEADTFALGKDIAEPITGTTRTYIVRCLNDNIFEERSIDVTRQ